MDVNETLKLADEQIELAERLEDIPAAAEAQRNAIYLLLRQLVVEVSELRKGQA